MLKRRQAKEDKDLEEILGEQMSVVLYPEAYTSLNWNNTQERLNLLESYLDIAVSPGSNWLPEELERATSWYRKYGFPGHFRKNYKNADIARREELVFPILEAAKSLKALMTIYDAWRKRDAYALSKLRTVESTPRNSGPNDFLDTFDRETEKNREHQRKIIQYMLKRKKIRKYPYLRNLPTSATGNRNITDYVATAHKKPDDQLFIYFKDATAVYLSDYNFTFKIIEPMIVSKADFLIDDENQLFKQTETFLLNAANIMLKGIQPELIRTNDAKDLVIKWTIHYPWHAIAVAFAELISNNTLEFRRCEGCGKDISDRKAGTDVCSDRCQKRKTRKIKI